MAAMTDPSRSRAELTPRQRFWALTALLASVALATLDTAIVNTALPTIADDLHASAAASIWVVTTYQLAMVAMLLPLASLGDIVGHRRVYLGGLMLFVASSLACGVAWSLPSLAVARVLQGLGAAAIMSVNAAILRYIAPPDRLGRTLGLNSLVVGLGFAIGPTLASAILSVADWPWLFLVNVPVGVAALLLAWPALPETTRTGHDFDAGAAAASALMFAALILGLGEATHAAPAAFVALEWGVALACLLWLLRRQAGHPAPMLPVDLFRRPVFALSAVTAVCSFSAQGLAFVGLPFLFQHMLGRSQVETGFLMTPWPLTVALMAPIAGRLVDRYPAGVLCGIGLAMLGAGMAALACLPPSPATGDILWRMGLCGMGFGFFQSPNLKAILTSAPPQRSGAASGIIGTARLLGQSTGAALVAACFHILPDHGPTLACWTGACFATAGSVASFLRLVAAPKPAAQG